MAQPRCARCGLRARYDKNPKSFLGRFWRWHTNWCPGWRSYMKSLPDGERAEIKARYNM